MNSDFKMGAKTPTAPTKFAGIPARWRFPAELHRSNAVSIAALVGAVVAYRHAGALRHVAPIGRAKL